MIDLFFENIQGFKKAEITDVIKKSVKTGIDEINLKKKYYLSIFITDNIKKKNLKSRYRKKNKTTNVLSFPQNETNITKESSKILVLDNGNLVESGSHKELLNSDGIYKSLYKNAFEDSSPSKDTKNLPGLPNPAMAWTCLCIGQLSIE